MWSHTSMHRITIGWREWVGLPDLGVQAIKAKVDTGARSSALHAWDVEIATGNGTPTVHFTLHPYQRDLRRTVRASAPLLDMRMVRASSGHEEERPVIRTQMSLFGRSWPIDVTLSRRDAMGFRMLLGRQAVRGRFVVDPGRSFLGGRPEKGTR